MKSENRTQLRMKSMPFKDGLASLMAKSLIMEVIEFYHNFDEEF